MTALKQNNVAFPFDAEFVLDDNSLLDIPPVQSRPGMLETLNRLENEKLSAYSQMHRMVADIALLKYQREGSQREVGQVHADSLYRLALMAEYRAGDGAAKIARMGVLSALLTVSMGYELEFCDAMQLAAPLLDIGEISWPDHLRQVPELNDADRVLMQAHCQVGSQLLDGARFVELRLAGEIALSHHENFDGSGYPLRLSGEDIPLGGRIVAVIDTFDALCSERPYRPAYAPQKAAELVISGSGSRFDPDIIRAFQRDLPLLLQVRKEISTPELAKRAGLVFGQPPEAGLWQKFI